MKNRNDKTKKWLIVAGGVVICAALLVMIGTKLKKEPVTETEVPAQSTEISDVVVDDTNNTATKEKEEEVTVAPIEVTEEPQKDSGAVDTGTEQKIQGDIPKKPTHTKEQLTDPTKKPNGEKVDSPKAKSKDTKPTPKSKKTEKKAETKTEKKTESKTKSSGGLPGFDKVPDGGKNHVSEGESDGDINKQVGTMD